MLIRGEDLPQPLMLLLGEQISAGPKRPSGAVERVTRPAAMPGGVLLDPLPAPIQRVASQGDDMERIHHRSRLRELLGGDGLEPGEPIHGHHSDPVPELLGLGVEPGLEHLLGTPIDHVEQPCRSGAAADRGQVDDHGHEVTAGTGVAPAVLITS